MRALNDDISLYYRISRCTLLVRTLDRLCGSQDSRVPSRTCMRAMSCVPDSASTPVATAPFQDREDADRSHNLSDSSWRKDRGASAKRFECYCREGMSEANRRQRILRRSVPHYPMCSMKCTARIYICTDPNTSGQTRGPSLTGYR